MTVLSFDTLMLINYLVSCIGQLSCGSVTSASGRPVVSHAEPQEKGRAEERAGTLTLIHYSRKMDHALKMQHVDLKTVTYRVRRQLLLIQRHRFKQQHQQ